MGGRSGDGRVVIVRTGVANVASVRAALRRLGPDAVLTDSACDVERAEAVVLPGVGSFGAVMERLDRCGLRESIRERVCLGRATLCVCAGMQVLFERSEESPGATGLGVAPGRVVSFPVEVRRPQLGWNAVTAKSRGGLVSSGAAYFANSYCARDVSSVEAAGWSSATALHGGEFVAAMWKGNVLACQFHPELSGAWGMGVLERWLSAAKVGRDVANSEEAARC